MKANKKYGGTLEHKELGTRHMAALTGFYYRLFVSLRSHFFN